MNTGMLFSYFDQIYYQESLENMGEKNLPSMWLCPDFLASKFFLLTLLHLQEKITFEEH